jgi:uncharacterized protein involved in type VI secretion and phage assembly
MNEDGMNEGGMNKFYGKYRATVFNNVDPEQRGRIQAIVPDVLGITPSSWAMPSLPIAGKQMGAYFVPQIGSGVWIEFEQGDPDYPIWTGCFWGIVAEVPALALAGNPASPSVVLQTGLQNTIVISDVPGPTGGIMLKSATGAFILVNDVGITISNGKGAMITMVGPTVTINNGALVIT